jgi:uncharacterized delta-60 repeat protein
MKRIIQAVVLIGPLFAFFTGASAWEARFNGSGVFSADSARAVAVDATGNVVAAGQIENLGTAQDFTVVKFDASGRELWRQVIDGSAATSTPFDGDAANAVVVDAGGDVIAAGATRNSDTGQDFTVIKFNGATGAELWRQVIPSAEARTIAVDGRGDLIVAGGVGGDFLVVKLGGADGRELWRQIIEGSSGLAGRTGWFNSVAVDATGDVSAAGAFDVLSPIPGGGGGSGGGKFIVTKFDGGSGAELWRQVVTGTISSARSEALTVTVDDEGNVFAGGDTTNTGTSRDFTVIKLDGASGLELWRQAINGTANSNDLARAVTVDAAGNVFAAGLTVNAGFGDDFTVAGLNGTTGEMLWLMPISSGGSFSDVANAVTLDYAGAVIAAGRLQADVALFKFDAATGALLWRQFVKGTLNDLDEAFAVAVDEGGNPVAAGVTINAGTGRGDFTAAKLDGASGDELWRQDINGSGTPSSDTSIAVAIGERGHVIAAGSTTNIGTAADFTVARLDRAHGTELWRTDINGPANGDDYPSSAAVDEAGDVVVAGRSEHTGPVTRFFTAFTVVKLAGESGGELWRYAVSSPEGFAEARAVDLDLAGDVVAAGSVRKTGSLDDFAVVKLDGKTGSELWQQVIKGSANTFDFALAVTVDAAGNVVAAGRTENIPFSRRDFTVAKLDGTTGSQLWLKAVRGAGSSFNDQANAVVVDGTGNVVAAGVTENIDPFGDFTVIKFDGVSGEELWHQALRGTGNLLSEAMAVAVDPAGDVVAAGSTHNTGSGDDLTVVKFDGAAGTELWRQVINGSSNQDDQALSVSLDGDGHVIVGGVLRNIGSGGDFTVLKLDRATGAELWRRVIDGTEHGDDVARAVVAGPAGNVAAAGSVRNIGTGVDFTVIKLRGSDGEDFVGRASLTVSPRVVRVGGTITATWSGISEPTDKDWIGIYSPGAANREPIDWIYVSCSKTPGDPQAEGSCPIVLPWWTLTPGEYELRLFANDSLTRLARSGIFRVRLAVGAAK